MKELALILINQLRFIGQKSTTGSFGKDWSFRIQEMGDVGVIKLPITPT